jgi:hypothetical protein
MIVVEVVVVVGVLVKVAVVVVGVVVVAVVVMVVMVVVAVVVVVVVVIVIRTAVTEGAGVAVTPLTAFEWFQSQRPPNTSCIDGDCYCFPQSPHANTLIVLE